MDLQLKDKVAVITGASRGIGRAIATVLAQEGMRLVLTSLTARNLDEVARSCKAELLAMPLDLRQPSAAQDLIDAAIQKFGRIDLLVNNAGAAKSGDFLTLADADWQDGFDLKFMGAMRCSRAAWPHLQQSRGCVVNIAGVGGRTGKADTAIGGAVNAALLNLTKVLADRGVKDGVRVNAINPSAIATERLQGYMAQMAADKSIPLSDVEAHLAITLGTQRLGQPEEVARAVAFLASPTVSYCQGAILDIDGGQTRTL